MAQAIVDFIPAKPAYTRLYNDENAYAYYHSQWRKLEDKLINHQKALDAMSENQLRRIPIVDDDHKILGIIAQADVATRFNHPKKTGAMVKEISQADGVWKVVYDKYGWW